MGKQKHTKDVILSPISATNKKRYFYVYEIYDKKNNKKYIGFRSSVELPENDLGKNYFSSSSNKEFIENQILFPELFEYKILKTFSNMKDGIQYEKYLLEKYDVKNNKNYYNLSNGYTDYYIPNGTKWLTNGKEDIKLNSKNIDQLDYFIERGFYPGRCFNENYPKKNKKMIYKEVNNKLIKKYIYEFELEDYLKNGYTIEKPKKYKEKRYFVYCGNKQTYFLSEKERNDFLSKPENSCWKRGQFKRHNFSTKGIVLVYNIYTKEKLTVSTEQYKKLKYKKYIVRNINPDYLKYGLLLNEYDDILFEGFYGEMKNAVGTNANVNGEIIKISKYSKTYDYLLKIDNIRSLKIKWKTLKTWDDIIKEYKSKNNPELHPKVEEKISKNNTINFKYLKQKDIKQYRNYLLKKQDYKCPICNRKIHEQDANLDHCHESGLIRGVLCKTCNAYIEGTFRSKWKRSGLSKIIAFEELLFNLYSYLDKDFFPIFHPSHTAKPRKLKKMSYNKLKKEIEKTNNYLEKPIKIPQYPKSKRLTKRLKELYDQFGIIPEFYSK